jgi:hypothetical protein
MARVYRKTKRSYGKQYRCRSCGQPITEGQDYYTWSNRRGRSGFTSYIHASHGFPKPSMLSSKKTAVIEDEIGEAQIKIGGWNPDVGEAVDYSEVADALASVASVASDVADEYESGADNMPENLQYGTQAEAMRDVAERLREWAGEMEDWTPDSEEPDLPDRDEFTDEDEYDQAVHQAWDDWADEVRNEAESKLEDMPEYEG